MGMTHSSLDVIYIHDESAVQAKVSLAVSTGCHMAASCCPALAVDKQEELEAENKKWQNW